MVRGKIEEKGDGREKEEEDIEMEEDKEEEIKRIRC